MPLSHNLDRHDLTNTRRNWANPIPKRLRSLAYGEAGTIPLQVNQVQPLPANTMNGSGRDMPGIHNAIGACGRDSVPVVTAWSGVVDKWRLI